MTAHGAQKRGTQTFLRSARSGTTRAFSSPTRSRSSVTSPKSSGALAASSATTRSDVTRDAPAAALSTCKHEGGESVEKAEEGQRQKRHVRSSKQHEYGDKSAVG